MPDAHHLLCRTRITYVDAVRSVSEACILCPRRGTSISRAECLACAECGGASRGGAVGCLYHGDWQPDPDPVAGETPLWRMMPARVACVRASVGAPAAMVLLYTLDASALPVVDDAGRPIGIIAASDLVHRACVVDTVADRMSSFVFALPETETVARAAELMEYEGISHLAVVSRAGVLVGQVTARDLLGWIVRQERLLADDPGLAGSAARRGRLASGTGERAIP